MNSRLLTASEFRDVTRLTPLVSIDLILRNPKREVLLGTRTNEPARGFRFVPGGRIFKAERLSQAFSRVLKEETGFDRDINDARFLGVYEHIYTTNYFHDASYGTHYVVLAYEIIADDVSFLKLDRQHSNFVWWSVSRILKSKKVHRNTKAYFE